MRPLFTGGRGPPDPGGSKDDAGNKDMKSMPVLRMMATIESYSLKPASYQHRRCYCSDNNDNGNGKDSCNSCCMQSFGNSMSIRVENRDHGVGPPTSSHFRHHSCDRQEECQPYFTLAGVVLIVGVL